MSDAHKINKVSIGWTRGTGAVSWGIRRLEKSYFNHVYYRFDLSNGITLIYESHLSGGIQITPYEHLLSAKIHGRVTDIHEVDLGLTDGEAQLLWNDCLPLHGKEYNTRQILIYYAWIRFLKRKSREIFKYERKDKYTCNQFVVDAGREVVPALKGTDDSFTPEKLFKLFHGGAGSREWARS